MDISVTLLYLYIHVRLRGKPRDLLSKSNTGHCVAQSHDPFVPSDTESELEWLSGLENRFDLPQGSV